MHWKGYVWSKIYNCYMKTRFPWLFVPELMIDLLQSLPHLLYHFHANDVRGGDLLSPMWLSVLVDVLLK